VTGHMPLVGCGLLIPDVDDKMEGHRLFCAVLCATVAHKWSQENLCVC